MDLTNYLSDKTKKYAEDRYIEHRELNDKLRLKAIGAMTEEPTHVIRQHILNTFGQDAKEHLFSSECEYTGLTEGKENLENQYVRFTDFYQLKRSQYVMLKELDITVAEVRKYIIHHSVDKLNDNITNIHLFYNQKMHKQWHWIQKKYTGTIFDFTYNYIINELDGLHEEDTASYEKELREYMKLIQILEEKQKCTLINIHTNAY